MVAGLPPPYADLAGALRPDPQRFGHLGRRPDPRNRRLRRTDARRSRRSDGALRHQLRRQGRGRAAGAARRGFRLPAYRSERRGGPRRRRRTESTDDRSARRTGGAADLRSGLRMGVSRLAGHPSRPPDALPAAHPYRRAGPLHDLAERLPSRHGGGLRRTEPDGAATATCGAMPSSTSSSTVSNNGRKIQVSTR